MNKLLQFVIIFAVTGMLSAFFGGKHFARSISKDREVNHAIAVLHPTQDSRASGVVTFSPVGDKVRISATVKGLTTGKHGFHIHEFGDCSASDATSAGGHYNPEGHPHSGPNQALRHVGDLGNLEANLSGWAHYERFDHKIQLNGFDSIIGRAVIVHAKMDDLTSQPTGTAGARQACGVIGISQQ